VRPTRTTLVVVGVGGGGGNAINRMVHSGVRGVRTISVNTDAVALARSEAEVRLPIGPERTRGLGAGGDPAVGRAAAEEARSELKRALHGADMVFITAGMGGGTGTGAAPVVAEVAKELGAVTVGVVTKPFHFEGPRRMQVAEAGVDELRSRADTVLVVPNDRLLGLDDSRITLLEAFDRADQVLCQGVRGIADIITTPGNINVDFNDVRSTMQEAGTALMGIGEGDGEDRAMKAARAAISSPLLETPIDGALRVLINITSGLDLTLHEVSQAVGMISGLCDPEEARVFFGWVVDETMNGKVRVTVLATGFPERRGPNAPQTQRDGVVPDQPGMPLIPPRPRPDADGQWARADAPVSVQTFLAADPHGPLVQEDSPDDDYDVPSILRRR